MTRPTAYGSSSSKPDSGSATAREGTQQVEQMRTREPPMLPPWSAIKAKRQWKIEASGPVHSLTFTPGGAHVVAVVQSGASGSFREIQVFETKSSQEVVLEPQENRPPSYQSMRPPTRAGHAGDFPLDLTISSGQFILHPGGGFEESIVRPDVGGSRLTVTDLYYPLDDFEDPDDALITRVKSIQFPMAISPGPQVLPGCDEVFAGVDMEDKGILRVYSWSGDEHLLRQRRSWQFPDDEITHLEFTGDGRRIVCLTSKKFCRLLDLATNEEQATPVSVGHEPEMLRTYQSPDGKVKVAVSVWQDVVMFNEYGGGQVETYSLWGAVGAKVRALCLTKDCEFLACATDNGFDIFQPRTKKIVQKGLGRGIVNIRKGCFSDDGRNIAVADAGGKIYFFKLSGSQWLRTK